MTSRRGFLHQASIAAALGLVAQLPARRLWATQRGALLPQPDEALLRGLALQAVDAARAAGARFADVRLGTGRSLSIVCEYGKSQGRAIMLPAGLKFTVGYGVRALVDGVWGFASGSELTADAVTEAARTAVAMARASRSRRARTVELAPVTPVANGVWATPIEQDPFAVPLEEQGDLALAALAEAAKVPEIRGAMITLDWRRTTGVFASTDGSLLVQHVALARPETFARAQVGPDRWRSGSAQVESLRKGGYGYEAIGPATLVAAMRQAAERAVVKARAARAPTSVEVGRYDLVLGPDAMASLLLRTVAEAVDLERALGYRANREGTSFAAPPLEMLGRYQVGSKLLTVRADRSQPHGAATVGWDDEGVAPEDYTVVRDGVITDYHTSRETAPELAGWYRSRGAPVRAHGCARGAGRLRPMVQMPNLALEPGAGNTAVEDLIADTKRGLYVESASGIADQQVLSGQFAVRAAREIRNGKLGDPVEDVAFQIFTPQFWKGLDALGGAASAKSQMPVTDRRGATDPLQLPFSTLSAVPARVRQVNVLNTGRTA